MVAAKSGKLLSFITSQILPLIWYGCSFFLFRFVSSILKCGKIYIEKWTWNVMAVILNVTSDHYYIHCILELASCEIYYMKFVKGYYELFMLIFTNKDITSILRLRWQKKHLLYGSIRQWTVNCKNVYGYAMCVSGDVCCVHLFHTLHCDDMWKNKCWKKVFLLFYTMKFVLSHLLSKTNDDILLCWMTDTKIIERDLITVIFIFIFWKEAFKPNQAKVLTGGGDLRFAQVDVPLSVSHYCVWPQSSAQ